MTTTPEQLLLPLLFAIEGDPALDRQSVIAERIRNLELVKEETSMTTSRIIRMTIPRAPRPSREEWEAERRRFAEHFIDTGEHDHDYSGGTPEYTDADDAEIDALTPEAIKAVRRACGHAERDLREKHPAAGAVARGIVERPMTAEVIERWYASEAALTGADKDAYRDLIVLRDIRAGVRKEYRWFSVTERAGAWQFDDWPQRYEPPSSRALDRLRALHAEGVQRRHDSNVARGQQLLVELESGDAWRAELQRRELREREGGDT